jgi:hypothetical protein
MAKKAESLLMLGAALVAAWGSYFAVIPYQRKLILLAVDGMTLYDGTDRTKVIEQLSKGVSAEIVECRDTGSEIEPAIRLSNGRMAYPRDGRFRIDNQPTGLLSRPRYLGCPGS